MSVELTLRTAGVSLTLAEETIVLRRKAAEIVAVGVSGPQGPAGTNGAPGVVAATTPITYDSGTQTVALSTPGIDAIIQREGVAPLRRWHRDLAAVRYARKTSGTAAANVLWVGDSIGEGFDATTPYSQQMVKRFAANLAQLANANGRVGQYVVGYRGTYRTPRFTTTGTTSPTAVAVASKGLGLQALTMSTNATASITFTGTGATIYYRRRNALGGTMSYTLTDSGGNPVASGGLGTFSSAVGAPGAENVAAVTVGYLTRGSYTLTVTATGGAVVLDGAYLYDGDEDTGVRVWNSSLFGSKFDTWRDQGTASLGTDAWQVLRTNLYDANVSTSGLPVSLVVLALGSNQLDSSDFSSKVSAVVSAITSAITAGGNATPSIALLLPPSNKQQTTDAAWATRLTELYAVAATNGWAVWDWAELTGSVKTDPLGWTDDQLHPIDAGHVAVGDFAAKKATEGISTLSAVEDLRTYVDAADTATAALAVPRSLLTSKGDILTRSSTAATVRTVGTDNQVLIADSTYGTGLKWASITDANIGAGAAIAPSKISGTAVVTSDSRLSDTRTPTDGSVTDAKIATTLSPSKITGTAVVTSDSRLSDTRTPTDGSVTDAKIASTLSPSKITGTATTNANMAGFLGFSTSQFETVPRWALGNAAATINTGTEYFSFFTPLWNLDVNTVTVYVVAAGTSITSGYCGLYTWDDSTATATLVASSPTSTTWLGTTGLRSITLSSTYTLTAGTRYAVALVSNHTGSPTVSYANINATLAANSLRMTGSLTSTTLVSSQTSGFGSIAQMIWARLQKV